MGNGPPWLVYAAMFAMFALVFLGAFWDRWLNLRGVTRCCGAKKNGYPTPFGYVVSCSKCRGDVYQ